VRGADDQAVENFLKLERLYEKWNSGLFGSRKFYERELRKYLGHLIYKNIETPGDFVVLSPEGIHEQKVQTSMRFRRWLEIRGELNADDEAAAAGVTPQNVKTWWRSTRMIAVHGKVLKARPAYNTYGRSVELYLEKIGIKKAE
jgi:hypothetical protein